MVELDRRHIIIPFALKFCLTILLHRIKLEEEGTRTWLQSSEKVLKTYSYLWLFYSLYLGVRAVGNGLHHRIKRAYYPPYNYYYGPTFYQQQTRRNNIYPSYAMEPTRAFYPGYMQQSFERSYQQPYYQQARYQAPTVSFGATPFSGTVTPSKRTLYNFNTNPNPIALLTSSVKKYETLNSKKPIKMINIPFKEKTHFFIHKQNKQKPSLVSSAQNSISSHKRKHNGTVKTFVDSDKYRDRGLISRFNKLVKSFHKVSGIDSKELKNSSSKTLEDGEMKNPMEFEETRANRQNGTEEDTFEIEDSSEKLPSKKSDGHLTKHKEDQSKKNLSRTVDTEYSKKNETKASGEMDVLEVVESDQSQSMKKINKTIRQFLPVSTKENVKKLQSKFLNTTEASAKSGTHPQSKKTANSKSSKSVTKSSGLEKIAKKVKDGWNEMADAAVKLIKGEPKNDDKAEGNKNDDKAEGSKKEDHKLKQLLTTNIKQQEARLAKDMTGEDLYDPTIKMVNPKIPHSLANDALHGDWFDTAREPNEKTKNDIKMSSDVLSEISNAKMKGKNLENIQVATKQESKKQYESRVKKITNLAESTENEIISGLIQGSLGDAMPDKKPLKLKNMEKLVSSPEKTDVGSIQKLLSKYNDDFDVFVDKTVDNHIAGEPGIGKVVKQVNTMMDILPENEQNNVAPPGDLSDVTGNKKNFNGHTSVKSHRKNITLIDSNDDDDDTLMKRLSEKWKMFKEANKDVLQDTKHQVKETGDNTSLKSKLAAKKNKEKDILSRYFDQVEEKQAVAQSKELEARQTKRKERLRSTLQMISNIEREIDSLVNKDTVSEDSPSVPKQTTVSDTEKKEHKQKKGKAEIFKELTGDKEEDIKQQQELSYLKETPESFTDGQQQSKTFMGEATPSYVEPDVEEESEQPQNFMAQPQYEGGVGKLIQGLRG